FVEELGRGSYGIVFKAYDETLCRLVAIKVLKPELAAIPQNRRRFEEEARKAARLHHQNVVTIYRVGDTSEFALPYFVMEYIDGEALSERLRKKGPVKPHEAAQIVQQIAQGLGAANHGGLVHRDIKPSNVMLETGSGRAKLTDFGLAKRLDEDGDLSE